MKPELKLVHLQLTLRCNLNCSFCGQWGENGYMLGKSAKEMPLANWLKVIDEIKQNENNPEFIIWGGEPLVSENFEPVVKALKQNNFRVSVVSNGVLLSKFADVINEYVDKLFISLDGPAQVHEKIRARKGIFQLIVKGIEKLNSSKVELINLLTICEANINEITNFPTELFKLGFSEIIYQNLIYCSSNQAKEYKKWMLEDFGIKAEKINSWITDNFCDWIQKLPEKVAELKKLKVTLFPFELNSSNILDWFDIDKPLKDTNETCAMPYRHLHINPDGNAHFCVDFNDFTLGNVMEDGVYDLFTSSKAEKFRKTTDCGKNPLCKRCPWFYNKSII